MRIYNRKDSLRFKNESNINGPLKPRKRGAIYQDGMALLWVDSHSDAAGGYIETTEWEYATLKDIERIVARKGKKL